ncbi:MarR family winged helix-turn-helix transcriptional regulator [Microbacterium sp. HD4P20]|uniref:MarR family winged helix-turn-helix transcriptional regulator n=1 Tax=Microbacterium sp. HD4P20 TaxID=2864874 RepID=UPI001C640CB3|nr:MarR family winged helix-turn-helix transcriptional regulator [Microbacterium sp. HD4P20]MCP2635689.1 MarR family winged helix-turn-helix transcriptional regulator [Microbacterium sp. HD4P20]
MANDETPIARAVGDDLVTEPLEEIIDPENFTPRLLALLSNALVWRESHELRRQFRLGTNDWRVISALAIRPGASATEVSEFIGVNKAVVSKSVYTLTARALITLVDGPRGSRPMYLTAAGARMHDAMLPISMSGQGIILDELTPEQTTELNALLRRMIERVREAQVTEEASETHSVAEPAH